MINSKLDDEFISQIKSFEKDLSTVQKHFMQINNEKVSVIKKLDDSNLTDDQIKELLHNLIRIQTKERRYFKLIRKRFDLFRKKVQQLMIYRPDQRDEIKRILSLRDKYLTNLREFCDIANAALSLVEDKIAQEEAHLKRASGGIFTRDFRKNFVDEYNKFLEIFRDISKIMYYQDQLKNKHTTLFQLGRDLTAFYNSKDFPTIMASLIGISTIARLTQGDFLGSFIAALFGTAFITMQFASFRRWTLKRT